jgi:hypothetical protein
MSASATGEKNPRAKLNDARVRIIKTSREPSETLSEQFGVSKSTIIAIGSERIWQHVVATDFLINEGLVRALISNKEEK